MRLCIVGGALQGMEAVFLANKAGYESVVIDRRPEAPALSICDEPHVIDVLKEPEKALDVLESCDCVLPAIEELDVLGFLDRMLRGSSTDLLFDMHAYAVSQSKLESNRLMAECGVPLPGEWPGCGYPVVVKPSSQSGSIGVSVVHDDAEMEKALEIVRGLGDDPVVQEFVHGRSVSIEVIGDGTEAVPCVTTEVVLDEGYDCKQVDCFPCFLDGEDWRVLRECSGRTAESLGLSAIMDVEAILTPKGLRFLEIDARIPSQTPAAIWTATGVNLLEMLVRSRGHGIPACEPSGRSGIYWHLMLKDGVLRTTGEEEFSRVSEPVMESGLFGSDDSISDYSPGKKEWHGTFMVSGATPEEARSRRLSVIQAIMEECGVERFVDSVPKEA